MPSRAVEQCCYKEGRRRCRKNGTGNPPLCNAHRLAFQQAFVVEEEEEPGLAEVFSDFLNGRGVNVDQAAQAVTGFVMGGIFGRFYPPIDTSQPPPGQHYDPRVHGRTDWRPPPARPAPDDPLVKARRDALVTLGFMPTDEPDAAAIRSRHRELAKKHHPDRGGSVEKMARINHAVDVLIE